MTRIWIAVGSLLTLRVALACTSSFDCSLNGKCDAGKCVCKSYWIGEHCEYLNLVPAAAITDGLFADGVSTWGAGIVRDQTTLHAYTAEFTNHCGVDAWTLNSMCVHYTADNPLGPFTRRDVVQSVFCHNPSVTVTTDGHWLLYHIGNGVPLRESPHQWTSCKAGATIGNPFGNNSYFYENDHATSVLSSTSPNGPWRIHNIPTRTSAGALSAHLDNPAPLPPHSLKMLQGQASAAEPREDFPIMFAARNRYDGCPQWDCSQLGIARSRSGWNGTYVLDTTPVCQSSGKLCGNGTIPDWRTFCEDPFFWIENDDTWHLLCNSKDCPPQPGHPAPPPPHYPYLCNGHGMHAYSADGQSWTWSITPAYNTTVHMRDGSTVQLQRRERPHLLFDSHGVPTHLYTAVTGTPTAGTDRSHTFAQALQGSSFSKLWV